MVVSYWSGTFVLHCIELLKWLSQFFLNFNLKIFYYFCQPFLFLLQLFPLPLSNELKNVGTFIAYIKALEIN